MGLACYALTGDNELQRLPTYSPLLSLKLEKRAIHSQLHTC